jgi:hypothetical protein
MTIFCCLRLETPSTWRARSLCLYPPGAGWPSYTPRHCVPTSSSSKTRRTTVEVFIPASTWAKSGCWASTAQSFLALVSSRFETCHHNINRNNIFHFVPHRKHPVSITTANRLMLLREIISVYCVNNSEHTSTLCR